MSRSKRSRHPRKPAPDAAKASAPPSSDRFEARCACGVVLRGQRLPGETSVVCSRCGTELPLKTVSGDGMATPGRGAAPAESPRGNAASSARSSTRRSRSKRAAPPDVAVHPERLEQRRRLSALRIKVAAVALLVGVTIYWGWQQRQRQHYLLDLQVATQEGSAALDKGEFDRAVELLAAADRAAHWLRANDTQGRQAQQLYCEALIWSKLAVTGVDEFFFAQQPPRNPAQSAALIEAFDRELAGRTVIIQSRAVRESEAWDDGRPDAKAAPVPPALALDWRVVGDGWDVRIAAEDVQQLASLLEGEEQELLFGAELGRLEADPRTIGAWRLRLAPASCVPLTAEAPFSSLGWPDLPQLAALLDRQRTRLSPAASPAVEEAIR